MENYFFSPLRFHWGQVRKFHHRGAGQGRAGAMGCWNRRLVKTGWCMLLWKRWLMVDVFTWWFDMMVDMVGLVLTYEKIYCEMPWLIYDLTWFSVWCLLKKKTVELLATTKETAFEHGQWAPRIGPWFAKMWLITDLPAHESKYSEKKGWMWRDSDRYCCHRWVYFLCTSSMYYTRDLWFHTILSNQI